MTDKEPILIDGYTINQLKELLYTGQRMSISTKTFEALIDILEFKTAECEELKAYIKEDLAPHAQMLNKQLQSAKQKVEKLEAKYKPYKELDEFLKEHVKNKGKSTETYKLFKYNQAFEKIKKIAKKGLEPICYKSNCNNCSCYRGEDANAGLTALINCYFDDNGDLADGNGDFIESIEGLIDNERSKCNKAKPICEQILQKCEVLKDE